MTTLTDTQVITASGGLVELGYKERTTTMNVTATSAPGGDDVITSVNIVADGVTPVVIDFYTPVARPGLVTNAYMYFSLFDGSTEVVRDWGLLYNASGSAGEINQPCYIQYRYTPTAGAHSYTVKARVSSGTGNIGPGAAGTGRGPAFLRVSKIVQATQWPAVTTGTIICTSSTRPASPFEGQRIYQTDDNTEWVYDGSAWRVGSVVAYGRKKRTSGSVSITTSTWADVDTNLDITLTAAAGDLIEACVSTVWNNQAVGGYLDVVTVVGGSPVNSFGNDGSPSNSNGGISAWFGTASVQQNIGGSVFRKLVSGDISSGTVLLRLRAKTNGGTKTLYGDTDLGFEFWARNHGQAP